MRRPRPIDWLRDRFLVRHEKADGDDLRALLPTELAVALPTQPSAVLFVAVAVARAGMPSGDLVRQLRLNVKDANIIVEHALNIPSGCPRRSRPKTSKIDLNRPKSTGLARSEQDTRLIVTAKPHFLPPLQVMPSSERGRSPRVA